MHNVKGIWGRRLPFPFNLFQQDKPATYHIKCKNCAWEKTYRVFSGTVWYAPGITPAEIVVKTKGLLPAICPECGVKVNKYRLPCLNKESAF